MDALSLRRDWLRDSVRLVLTVIFAVMALLTACRAASAGSLTILPTAL